MQEPIIIIGAGIGGLSAGIHLAAAGFPVKIFEKNPQVGGKMSEIHVDDFRWDTGPSVITMRHVLRDLFKAAGRNLRDYIKLHPVEPLTRYFYPDGITLDATRQLDDMLRQIEALDDRDVDGYLRYLAYAARLHRLTGPVFIYNEPPTLASFLQVNPIDALRVDGLRTMDRAIQSFVKSPHLRQLLGRFATYVGASPFRAPATLNVIGHVELSGGVWYPEGGIYSIARALEKVAREMGIEIYKNTPVQEIGVFDGAVYSVITADGERHPARAVIANLDVSAVYEKLLSPDAIDNRRIENLKGIEPSCSGFVMLLGVQEQHAHLAHHNIFFSSDYEQEFTDIFERGIPPEEPTIYISITSKTTPDDAPIGHENWFVLVNAPALDSSDWDWEVQAEPYRDLILNRLATRFGLDVRRRIVVEKIFTPHDLERLTGARRGALYGASSNNRWAAFRRPHNRAPDIEGLYFAGGTTHPGGGVPMVMLSGRVAAKMVIEDLEPEE